MKMTIRNWGCLAFTAWALTVPWQIHGQEPEPAQEQETPSSVALTNEIQTAVPESELIVEDSWTDQPDEHKQNAKRLAAIVTFGKTAELKAGESAEAVVAIGGSAKVQGRVREAVVAIFGNADVNSEVRDAVVAVLGNVKLGSNAVVHGDVVAVGGSVEYAEGAVVHGQVQPIDFAFPLLPEIDGLKLWIQECVFKLRPLSLKVHWVWIGTGIFVLLYFLTALAFPKPVRICLDEVTTRPATTFFVGLLAKIFIPLLLLFLAATGIGLLVVPFIFAALFFGALVGKAAVLQHVGNALVRIFGIDGRNQPLLSLLVGTVMMLGLYLVPVVGFLTYAVLGLWGLGAAITGALKVMCKEKNPVPPTTGGGATTAGTEFGGQPTPPAGISGSTYSPETSARSILSYPRAGFWERMGAAFLDFALMLIPLAVLGPLGMIVVLAYFAGMWAWKGTTLGGIVLNHQIVRHDGSPLTFTVALVRGCAAVFSAAIFFLGFFWIGWNPEKQGWHDKIAGTCVVRLPRATPLLCI